MRIHFTTEDLLLWIIKYFWIIAVLPKMVQFAVYLAILLTFFLKNRLSIDKTTVFFLAGAAVHVIAILWQCITSSPALSRVAAAINTSMIWIIAAIFYSIYKQYTFNEDILKKFSKYMRMNFFILFCIYLLSLVASSNTYTILGYTVYLRRLDYLSTGVTTRFCGALETVLGATHLTCIGASALLLGEDEGKSLKTIMLLLGAFIAVVATHSRTGTICCAAIVAAFIYQMIASHLSTHKMRIVNFALISAVILGVIIFDDQIIGKLYSVFYSRSGSNSTRFTIYRESLRLVLSQSPLIGMGIKYSLVDSYNFVFPYGSHCTYIGILYKTGVIGSLLYLIAFSKTGRSVINNLRCRKNGRYIMIVIAVYMISLITSDIDGMDWVIITAFSLLGLMSNDSLFQKEVEFVGK